MAKEYYQKEYKMRLVGDGGIEVSIPKILVEKVARQHDLTIEEFVKQFRVLHLFDDFADFDAAYKFVRPEEEVIK